MRTTHFSSAPLSQGQISSNFCISMSVSHCLHTWIISLDTFLITQFESNFQTPKSTPLLMVVSNDLRVHKQENCTYTHVPVDFTNSTSLIQTVWLSKHHKSLARLAAQPLSPFLSLPLSFNLIFPPSHPVCHLFPLQSLSDFFSLFPLLLWEVQKVCSMQSK